MLPPLYQKVRYFVMASWGFDHAYHRDRLQVQLTHCIRRGAHLSLSTVDHNQIWQRLSLFQLAAITAKDRFAHRSKVVGPFHRFYPELTIFGAVRLAVFEDHQPRYVFSPLYVRD